jgi:hypothetical protein
VVLRVDTIRADCATWFPSWRVPPWRNAGTSFTGVDANVTVLL